MQTYWLSIAALMITSTVPNVFAQALPTPSQAIAEAVIAQNPAQNPAENPVPNITQNIVQNVAQNIDIPVAQVNPNQPIRIEVINAGGTPFIATLSQPPSDERRVAAGGETSFGSLNQSFLPVPINLMLYPESPEIGLSSYVSADNNVVTIVVGEQFSDTTGDISVNIDADGNVYLY